MLWPCVFCVIDSSGVITMVLYLIVWRRAKGESLVVCLVFGYAGGAISQIVQCFFFNIVIYVKGLHMSYGITVFS